MKNKRNAVILVNVLYFILPVCKLIHIFEIPWAIALWPMFVFSTFGIIKFDVQFVKDYKGHKQHTHFSTREKGENNEKKIY
jgi:hypothetical protein